MKRPSPEPEESLSSLLVRGVLLLFSASLVGLAFFSASPVVTELLVPVPGVDHAALYDSFDDSRGANRRHGAIDIPAPWGTPVLASTDGVIHRLHESPRGGLGVYHLDLDGSRCFYYGHLARFARHLREGVPVHRGEVLGYVGTTGNASEDAPHLHFAVYDVGESGTCFGGEPVNPFPLLSGPAD